MSVLRFNADNHTYWLGDRRLPSVTQVINRIAAPRMVDDWYLQRGSAVHAAIELAMSDDLDFNSLDERIEGRVKAALAFINQSCLTGDNEVRLFSRRYQFAGTVDFFGKDASGDDLIVDWKGSLSPQVVPQLGGYSLLLREGNREVTRAVAVETHDDGTFKCKWLTKSDLRRAENTFLAMLTVHNWLQDNFPVEQTQ